MFDSAEKKIIIILLLSAEHSLLFFLSLVETRSSRLALICDGCCHHIFIFRLNNHFVGSFIPFCSQIGFISFGHHTHNRRPHFETIDAPPLEIYRCIILIHESIKCSICSYRDRFTKLKWIPIKKLVNFFFIDILFRPHRPYDTFHFHTAVF